jgi:hypothetical protein
MNGVRSVAVAIFIMCFPIILLANETTGGILVSRLDDNGKRRYLKRVVVDSTKDDGYGWWLTLNTNKKSVKARQVLTLPEEPETWGRLKKHARISDDGKTLVLEKILNVSAKGNVWYMYGIAKGDPKGIYRIEITIDDSYKKTFDFVVK